MNFSSLSFNFRLYDAFIATSRLARERRTDGSYALKQACYEMWHALAVPEVVR